MAPKVYQTRSKKKRVTFDHTSRAQTSSPLRLPPNSPAQVNSSPSRRATRSMSASPRTPSRRAGRSISASPRTPSGRAGRSMSASPKSPRQLAKVQAKTEKQARNRESQYKLRLRRKQWARLPVAFKRLFPEVEKNRATITKALYSSKTKLIHHTWSTGSPRLMPIEECIQGNIPGNTAIWDDLFKGLKGSTRVSAVQLSQSSHGAFLETINWTRAQQLICKQMGRPRDEPSHYASIVNLHLSLSDLAIDPAPSVHCDEIEDDNTEYEVNIGFTNQIHNFHIDLGLAGLSALAGECEKLWICARPSERNLRVLLDGGSFVEQCAKYSGLWIFRQTSSHVMFLPPGLIHATFTIKGGLLYGRIFRPRQHSYGATIGLLATMNESENQSRTLSGMVRKVVNGWIDTIRQVFESGTDREKAEARRALKIPALRELIDAGAFRTMTNSMALMFQDLELEIA